MGQPMATEHIVPAIRRNECRKINFPGFDNTYYYADRDGHIYSLRDPGNPKALDAKEAEGLWWVTIYTSEGGIKRVMVGDIVAYTFLDRPKDPVESTVTYNDSNPANNAVDNLSWDTPEHQRAQMRRLHTMQDPIIKPGERIDAPQQAPSNETGPPVDTAPDLPVLTTAREDPLLRQLHETQALLDASQKRSRAYADALKPFAEFVLSPAHQADLGTKTVLESNKGVGTHSILTVQHFRAAKNALNGETQ